MKFKMLSMKYGIESTYCSFRSKHKTLADNDNYILLKNAESIKRQFFFTKNVLSWRLF